MGLELGGDPQVTLATLSLHSSPSEGHTPLGQPLLLFFGPSCFAASLLPQGRCTGRAVKLTAGIIPGWLKHRALAHFWWQREASIPLLQEWQGKNSSSQ